MVHWISEGSQASVPPVIMLVLTALGTPAALLLVYIIFPALWLHLVSVDDSLDPHHTAQTLVASRMCPLCSQKQTPFLSPTIRKSIS